MHAFLVLVKQNFMSIPLNLWYATAVRKIKKNIGSQSYMLAIFGYYLNIYIKNIQQTLNSVFGFRFHSVFFLISIKYFQFKHRLSSDIFYVNLCWTYTLCKCIYFLLGRIFYKCLTLKEMWGIWDPELKSIGKYTREENTRNHILLHLFIYTQVWFR